KGGPDGGDGGDGGDIILKADSHVDNLSSFFYEPIIKAKSGGHGMGKKMVGRSAPNKVAKVPVGTVGYRGEDEAVAAVRSAGATSVHRRPRGRTRPFCFGTSHHRGRRTGGISECRQIHTFANTVSSPTQSSRISLHNFASDSGYR